MHLLYLAYFYVKYNEIKKKKKLWKLGHSIALYLPP